MITIVKHRHYFTSTANNFSKHIYDMLEFNNELVTHTMGMTRGGRGSKPKRITIVDKRLYIIENKSNDNKRAKDQIRYPISIYKDYLLYLEYKGINKDIKVIDKTFIESSTIDFTFNPDKKHRDYQTTYVNKIIKWVDPSILIDLQTGRGKEVSCSTLIRVLKGWKPIGNVEIGDMVTGKNGKPTTVTGVYPQGKKQLYTVTFADGRKVDAGLEHLWTIHSHNFTKIGSTGHGTRVMTTKEVMEYLDKRELAKAVNNTSRYYIDLVEPVFNVPTKFLLHPYLMGVLLNSINGLELTNDKICEKHIPVKYLEGSIEQRYELLRGLIDTGGEVSTEGCISYSTDNKQLVEDITLLVRSLGGICFIESVYDCLENKEVNKLFYKLNMRFKDDTKVVTEPKKLELIKYKNQRTSNLKLEVVSIEKSIKEEAVCISVSAEDKLFVVKDYIVTHNTMISISSLALLNKKFAVMILPRFIEKWKSDLVTDTDMVAEDILVIQGVSTLIKYIQHPELVKDYKCYIISLTTVNLFITSFNKNTDVAKAGVSPEDIVPTLCIDTVLVDEVHKEFYTTFRFMLYAQHRVTIGLTATLLTNQEDIEFMYNTIFPDEYRISNIIPYHRYIICYSISYKFQNPRRIKTSGGFGYSSDKFEKYILNNSVVKNHYFNMLYSALRTLYSGTYQKGDKALIFMFSKKMCSAFTEYLGYKFKNLSVARYTEEDEYEVIAKSDVIVSTIPSSGVGLDIHQLTTVLQTVNTNSPSDNIQSMGRLRDIPGREVKFAYFYSRDIDQHVTYHKNKKELFRSRVAKSSDIAYKEKL